MDIYRYLLSEPPEAVLDASRAALVVIDMQKLDAHPNHGWGLKLIESGHADLARGFFDRLSDIVVPNMQLMLEAARAVAMPLIHVRVAHQTSHGKEATRHHRFWGIRCHRDSVEAEFLDELTPEEDEYVIEKTGTSPFNSAAIDQLLRNLGVTDLVLCGVNTNACVELTCRDAVDRGYATFLVADGCAAIAGTEAHDSAVSRVAGCGAAVRSTADVVSALRGTPDAVPVGRNQTSPAR